MKKILSWVIAITLLLSLTPVLPVSADGEAYAVLGVQDGDRIILNPEVEGYTTMQHKVTIADSDQVSTNMLINGHLTNEVNFTFTPTATGIDSVVFNIDGTTALTDTEAPYEFVLGAEHKGEHTLTATIHKTDGGTEVKTIDFEGILGDIHASRATNYNSGTLDASNTPTFNGVISRGETIENGTLKLSDGNGISTVWLMPGVQTNEMELGDTKLFYIDYDLKTTAAGAQFELRTSRSFRASNLAISNYLKNGFPTNEWVHITVVADYERGWFSAYLNGIQFKSWSQSDAMLATSSDSVTDCLVPQFNGGSMYVDNYTVRTYDEMVLKDYELLGVQDGDRVILNPQVDGYTSFQHKVTVVNADQISTKLSENGTLTDGVNFTLSPQASGIEFVDFAIDGNTVATDSTYPYEFVLTGEHKGEHTLTATITRTMGSGTVVKTVEFEGIVGESHDSRAINYNSGILDASNRPTFNGVVSRGETIENGALKLSDGNSISTAWMQPDVQTNELQLGDTKLFYVDYDVKKSTADVQFAIQTSRSFRASNLASAGYIQKGMPAGQWVHITIVADYERGWFSAYMNGVLFKSWSQSDTMLASTSDLVTDSITPQFFGGDLYIDNYTVRTYDEVVPADFISSSVADGEEKVSERIAAIRVTGSRAPKTVGENGVTIQAGSHTLAEGVDYEISFTGNDLVITPLHHLSLGTVHTISITDVRDAYGCKFNEYPSFSFTTREATDNLKPDVTVSANDRYDYRETVTLTAVAKDDLATSDINGGVGAISYVEFLADGELIEGSRVTESLGADTYTFDWTNAAERLEAYTITARACDNNGEITVSEPILVQVFSPKAPEVSLSVPEKINGKILGVASGSIVVTASASDVDGAITSAELRLYGPSGTQIGEPVVFTENFDAMSYTFSEGLDVKGNYKVELTAIDDSSSYKGEDLSTVTEAFVYVAHMGKAYPAMLTDDLTDSANKAKWSLTGKADKTTDENGLTITQTESGTVTASRATYQLITGKATVAEMTVNFSDTTHERIISFDGVTERNAVSFTHGITFDANGKIILDSVEKGSYKKNTEYKITALLDMVAGKTIFFINGEMLGEIATTAGTTKLLLTMSVGQTTSDGTASFTIAEYGIYKLGESVDPSIITVTLKDKDVPAQTGTSFIGISQYPEYIAINANGIDAASVKRGVFLIGPDGKPCATTFADGKIYINEKLVAGAEYTLRLTSDIRVGDAGLAETVEYPVTTGAKTNGIDVSATEFTQVALAPDTASVSFGTEISGTGTVVCAVYVGNIMKAMIYEENQTGTVNLSVNLSTIFGGAPIPENAYIEAFVLQDLTDMAPVSDIIYRLN